MGVLHVHYVTRLSKEEEEEEEEEDEEEEEEEEDEEDINKRLNYVRCFQFVLLSIRIRWERDVAPW